MEGVNRFACSQCNKVCKSKGGLTNHTRRMHEDQDRDGSSKIPSLTSQAVDNMLADIMQNITESKLYPETILAKASEVFPPSPHFYESLAKLFSTFAKELSLDKLMKQFYGEMYDNWKTYFPSSEDGKYVFLLLIHLPEKLVAFQKTSVASVNDPKICRYCYSDSNFCLISIITM